jgi:hypothetical protein
MTPAESLIARARQESLLGADAGSPLADLTRQLAAELERAIYPNSDLYRSAVLVGKARTLRSTLTGQTADIVGELAEEITVQVACNLRMEQHVHELIKERE